MILFSLAVYHHHLVALVWSRSFSIFTLMSQTIWHQHVGVKEPGTMGSTMDHFLWTPRVTGQTSGIQAIFKRLFLQAVPSHCDHRPLLTCTSHYATCCLVPFRPWMDDVSLQKGKAITSEIQLLPSCAGGIIWNLSLHSRDQEALLSMMMYLLILMTSCNWLKPNSLQNGTGELPGLRMFFTMSMTESIFKEEMI